MTANRKTLMFRNRETGARRIETGRFASQDAQNATRQLKAAGLDLMIQSSGRGDCGIAMSWARLELDDMICMHWRCDNPIEVFYEPIDAYQLLLSASGTTSIALAETSVQCENQGASGFDIRDIKSVSCSASSENYVVLVPYRMLTKRIFELTGAPVLRKLIFGRQPLLGEAWMQAVAAMATALETPPPATRIEIAPHSSQRSSEMIIDLMLELMPHNYSDALSGASHITAPDHVKRTVAFMRRSSGRLLKVEELVPISGVSLRALQYGFSRFLGVSISDYERSIRLERARQDIERNPKERLTKLVKRGGFSNFARFNDQFEAIYGLTAVALRDNCLKTLPDKS